MPHLENAACVRLLVLLHVVLLMVESSDWGVVCQPRPKPDQGMKNKTLSAAGAVVHAAMYRVVAQTAAAAAPPVTAEQ